MNFTTANWNWC